MAGTGIKEKFLLFRPSRRGLSHWRRESFLDQLSTTGSMLWAPNHSHYWAEICSVNSGHVFSGWSALRRDLSERPANETRKILYLSSQEFVQQSETAWSEAAKALLFSQGELNTFTLSWRSNLDRAKRQLDDLSWCLNDSDTSRIDIIKKS